MVSNHFLNIFLFAQVAILLTLAVESYRKCTSAVNILDNYEVAMIYLVSLTKMVYLRLHLTKVNNVYSKAKNDLSVAIGNSIHVMKNHATELKAFQYTESLIGCLSVVQRVLSPLFRATEYTSNMPFRTSCIFINISSINYIFLYLLQSVGPVYAVFSNMSADILFFGSLMYICGQLEILQIEFNAIGKLTYHSKVFIRNMALLTKKHHELIQLTQEINKAFNFILCLNFALSALVITIHGT